MARILYLEDRKAGLHIYTPEMGERKPECKIEATLSHYGKHYYLDTPLELSGRGVELVAQHTEKNTRAGSHLLGWNQYKVTTRAFEAIKALHPVSMVSYLD